MTLRFNAMVSWLTGRSVRKPRRHIVTILSVAAVSGLTIGLHIQLWSRGPAEPYIIAAEDVWTGRIGPGLYDDGALADRTAGMTKGRVRDIFSPSPPSLSLLLLPLAWLPASDRSNVWLALNLGSVWMTFWLVARMTSWPTRRPLFAVAAAAFFLLSEPFAENLARGQIYALLMSSTAAAMMAARGSVLGPAGGLAICAIAKLWGGPMWLALMTARVWRTLLVASLVTLSGLMLSLYVTGLDTWHEYLWVVLPRWISTPVATVTAHQTIPAALAHLMRMDPQWNPHPAFANVPLLVFLAPATSFVLLVVTARTILKAQDPTAGIAASIVLSILVSPLGEQYHYLLLVPSCAVAIELAADGGGRRTAMLVLSLLLLGLPLPFKSSRVGELVFGVLSYPRLAGGLLLWLFLVTTRPHAPSLASMPGKIISETTPHTVPA